MPFFNAGSYVTARKPAREREEGAPKGSLFTSDSSESDYGFPLRHTSGVELTVTLP